MPKRIYVGSSAEVEFELPGGEVASVAKGASVEVSNELAKEMDASSAWSTTTSTGPKAADAEKEQ